MFKNPFSFEGRIRRTEYGLSILIFAAGRVALAMILAGASSGGDISPIFFILQIPFLWFFWAQGAKRCHDVGWNGWMQLIPFVPLYLIFGGGEAGVNKYGENPKMVSDNF